MFGDTDLELHMNRGLGHRQFEDEVRGAETTFCRSGVDDLRLCLLLWSVLWSSNPCSRCEWNRAGANKIHLDEIHFPRPDLVPQPYS